AHLYILLTNTMENKQGKCARLNASIWIGAQQGHNLPFTYSCAMLAQAVGQSGLGSGEIPRCSEWECGAHTAHLLHSEHRSHALASPGSYLVFRKEVSQCS